jgi:hypothetical protein
MALVEQRDHRIDRRQPGTDQQDRLLGRQVGQGIRGPRIRSVQRRVVERSIVHPGRFRRQVPRREYREIGGDRPSTVQRQRQWPPRPVDIGHQAAHELEPIPSGTLDFVVQQRPDIVPERLPRHESADAGRRATGLPRTQPFQKVVRPVVERAHAPGRHIEDMVGVARRISQPPSELAIAFDQNEPRIRRAAPQQMEGEQRSAETGTDNGNRGHAGCDSSAISRPVPPDRSADRPLAARHAASHAFTCGWRASRDI